MQTTVLEHDCGCEEGLPGLVPVSFCGRHEEEVRAFDLRADKLYRCGECGFQSCQWERLERHVYREHLGADRP